MDNNNNNNNNHSTLQEGHRIAPSTDLQAKRKAMSSVSSKLWLHESLLTCSNKVGLPKSITLWLMISILYISSTTATILIVLPQVNVDGNLVPFFFRDRPTYYRKFLVSTLFAFMGAFIALLIQEKPTVERFCRITAVASMLSSPAIILCRITAVASMLSSLAIILYAAAQRV